MGYDNSDVSNFWNILKRLFKNSPKKLNVIELIIESGLSIKDNRKIYCGNIEIPYKKIADALNIDRRSVIATMERIHPNEEKFRSLNDEEKNELRIVQHVLSRIYPAGIYLHGRKKNILEVTADSKESGIIAKVTTLIADKNISIRQILATDPYISPYPRLMLIADKEIPGNIVSEILEIKGVLTAKLIKS
ncbi:MAG: hypothetical protein ACTSPQ_17825 [Candidatus Helarchaeota archaeon]